MPGKVNPVMPELVNLVAFRVTANDLAVALAAQHGQLQLNAYEPLVGIALFESQKLLVNTAGAFRTQLRRGDHRRTRTCSRAISSVPSVS